MKRYILYLVASILQIGWLSAQQAPVAGIAFDHLSAGMNHYDFVIHVANTATGNPDTWQYTVTMTGCTSPVCISYANLTTASTSPVHSIVIAPPAQTAWRVWQIVSNAFGADTAYVDVLVDCSSITPPFAISMDIDTSNFPRISGLAQANIPFEFIETTIYGSGLTTPTKHSYYSSIQDTVMLPGPVEICGHYYHSVCTGFYRLCDTIQVACWRNPVVELEHFAQGQQVLFTDSVVATAGSTWLWDFGDGTTDTTRNTNVLHTYSQPGTYIACLTVTDTCGTTTTCDTLNLLPNAAAPSLHLDLDIAPNPTQGPVILRLNSESSMKVSIHLFDAQSRLIQTENMAICSGIHTNLLEMPTTPGIYFLRIQDTNGKALARSIVVQ